MKAEQTMENPQAVSQRMESFLRFRSVVEGYRILVQKKQREEMLAAQGGPPPGPGAPASGPGPAPGQDEGGAA